MNTLAPSKPLVHWAVIDCETNGIFDFKKPAEPVKAGTVAVVEP